MELAKDEDEEGLLDDLRIYTVDAFFFPAQKVDRGPFFYLENRVHGGLFYWKTRYIEGLFTG